MTFDMFNDLTGKRILVTGASTGIGAALAIALGSLGASVAIHFRSSAEQASQVSAEIKRQGGSAFLVQEDLSTKEGPARAVAGAVAQLGGLDILINNAGALVQRAPTAEVSEDLYEEVLNTNVRSVLLTTQAALPHLRQAGSAAIVNTSSLAARIGGGPGASIYAGAKAFVSNLTRAHAKEFAPFGIRVNAVSPGIIATPFHEQFSTPEWLDSMKSAIPLGRIGSPEDCVGAYLFLSSNRLSGYITGQTIEVNGGQLMP